MAETTELQLVVTAKDQATSTLKKVGGSVDSMLGVTKKVAAGLAIAGAGAVAFGVKAVKAFSESEEVSQKLETVVLNLKGATMENVRALEAQADALKRVGVLDDDVIKSAQAQLATFDLQSKSIEKVIPGLLDMIVAEKGMNASMEDAKMAAQGLGKAFQGNFEVLTKQGFVITDAQKKMIEFGNEAQKTEAIMQILGTTYNGVNEQMAQTNAGQILKAQQAFGDLEKAIGGVISNALTPFLPKITEAINNIPIEKIQASEKYFVAFGNAVVWTVKVIGGVLKTMQESFEAVFYAMFRGIDMAKEAWEGFKKSMQGIGNSIISSLKPAIDLLNRMIAKYNDLPGTKNINEIRFNERAFGGQVNSNKPYLVGERGPEVIIPPGQGTVKPLSDSGLGGLTVNIYNPPQNMDIASVVADVKRAINREQELTRMGAL